MLQNCLLNKRDCVILSKYFCKIVIFISDIFQLVSKQMIILEA